MLSAGNCKLQERYKTGVLTFPRLIYTFTYTHANTHTPKVAPSAGYCQSNLFLCHLVAGGRTRVHGDTHCFLKEQRHNRCDRPPLHDYLQPLPLQWLLFFSSSLSDSDLTMEQNPLKVKCGCLWAAVCLLSSLCDFLISFFFHPLIIKLTFQRTHSLQAIRISSDILKQPLSSWFILFLIMLCHKWAWDAQNTHV